jgi:hypothetical protein
MLEPLRWLLVTEQFPHLLGNTGSSAQRQDRDLALARQGVDMFQALRELGCVLLA